jgi:hypothetical protein
VNSPHIVDILVVYFSVTVGPKRNTDENSEPKEKPTIIILLLSQKRKEQKKKALRRQQTGTKPGWEVHAAAV